MDFLDNLGIEDTGGEPTMSYQKPANTIENVRDTGGFKKGKVNMYDVDVIQPKDIKDIEVVKDGKAYAIHVFFHKDDTDELKAKVTAAIVAKAKKLSELGYVFRFFGNKDAHVVNDVLKAEGVKSQLYSPGKIFNSHLPENVKPIMVNGYEAPFRYAAHLIGAEKFNNYKKFGRAVTASEVHHILGMKSNNPVDFVIAYNSTGLEFFKKGVNIDFSKVGRLWFYVKLCTRLDIPIYNIKNKESLENLNSILIENKTKQEGIETNG